jgi:NAD(P) transhydrogenase subunit alpha
VRVVGYTDLESRAAFHASQLYSRNVANYVLHLVEGGRLKLDLDDELVRFPMVAHAGTVMVAQPGGGA